MPFEGTDTPVTPEIPAIQETAEAPKPAEGGQNETETDPKDTEPPKTEEPNRTRLDYLVKRDRQLLERKQRLDQERTQWEEQRKQRETELERDRSEIDEFKRLLQNARNNPEELMKKAGLSYSDLTQFYLNNKQPGPETQIKSIQEELQAFRREQEEARTKAAEEAKKQAEQDHARQIEAFRAEVASFVQADSEKYELINQYGQQGLVADTIEEHFAATNKVLSNSEAAEMVERYLEAEAEKLVTTKKFKSKYMSAHQPPKDEEAQDAPSPPKTLSNSLTSSSSFTGPARTDAERTARAIAAMDRAMSR